MKEWIRSVRQGLGLAGAALLLHGCVSMSTHVPHQNYVIRSAEQRDAALLAMKSWSLQGAVSVQHASKVDVANIRWVQTPQSYRIHLASSLNAVTAELVGRGGRVVL